MRGITKRFGSVVALDSVDLEVRQGAIHAIVGENGAGKTTLMRVLQGLLRADSGTIEVRGREVHFRHAHDAMREHIGMVSQHYSIIPELTCLQNLMLGAEPGPWISASSAERRAQDLAGQMGFEFEWRKPAAGLSPAGAQKLEILKLLWRGSEIMILDEPTAMLSPADSDALFASLKQLTERGSTVLLVTHRLPEVMEHCEAITVLRGGKKVNDRLVTETTSIELAEMIVGHAVGAAPVRSFAPGEPMLQIRDLWAKGNRGDDALKGVSFELLAGEMVGVAGVDGNGQREMFHALMGLARASRGSIEFRGGRIDGATTRERIQRGFRLIPEDRHEEGVVEDWSLVENAALGLQRIPPIARGAVLDGAECGRAAARIADRFQTKHGGVGMPLRSLSGGNQQRFVAGRALELEPQVILAFQPTRGLDIDGTRQVYDALRQRCRDGACALVVSFDLDELLENCDRIVVLNGGRLLSPPPDKHNDRAEIGRLMVGA